MKEVQSRIRRQRLAAAGPAASAAPTSAAAVPAFAASVLTAPRAGAAGNRARLRRSAGRGPRDRVAENFCTCLSGFSPAIRLRTCRKPEYGFFALSGGVQPGRRSAIWPAYQFRHIGLSVRRGQSQTTATRRDADSP